MSSWTEEVGAEKHDTDLELGQHASGSEPYDG